MADIKIYGTLVRDDSTNVDKIVQGNQVEGGYFVCSSKPTSGVWTNGQLCYCTGDKKFYQYNGSAWVEADLGGGVTSYNDLTDKPIELSGSNYIIKDPASNNRVEINSSGMGITGNLELSGTTCPTISIIGGEGAGQLTVDQIQIRAICRGDTMSNPVILTAGGATDAPASQIIYIPSGLNALATGTGTWSDYEIVNKTMLGNPVKSIAIGSGDTNELLITYLNGSEETISVGAGSTADGVTIEEVETYLNDNSEEVDLASYFTKTDVDTLFNSIFEFDGTTLIIKDN